MDANKKHILMVYLASAKKKKNNTTQSSCAHINQARPNWKVPRLVRIDNGLQTLTLRGCVCVFFVLSEANTYFWANRHARMLVVGNDINVSTRSRPANIIALHIIYVIK